VNWKLKCLALHVLAHVPGSQGLHQWLQRRVTGRYLDTVTDDFLAAYNYHVENFRKLPDLQGATALEFGAGRNLITPLLLSAAGARRVLALDIERLATAEHINHVIRQLRERGVPYQGGSWREIADVDADLERYYRVSYCAPGDARATGLPAGSVDFICSTSTLEHIGAADIAAILVEARRIGAPGALLSFIVDYHDHYASADPRITRFNFYRYSDAAWAWFNPRNHFQNRLRHSDYEQLFAAAGLQPLQQRSIIPPNSQHVLQTVPLAPAFVRYSIDDMVALNGFFLLQTPPSAASPCA
jgi:hypothetical protein